MNRMVCRWMLTSSVFWMLLSCSVLYDQPRPSPALFDSRIYPLTPANEDAVTVAVIGDIPYGFFPSRAFHQLQKTINQDASVSWVLHAGDIKSGVVPCWKWLYRSRKQLFNRFQAPWVLTLGDNEWTDCHRKPSGGFAPLDRLAYLRELFFDQSAITALANFQGQSQGFAADKATNPFQAFKEHWRWVDHGVMFVSIHAVGSDNALRPFAGRTQADDNEVRQRNAAIAAWLERSYQWMKGQSDIHSVVILTHANPHFEQAKKRGRQWYFPMPNSGASEQEKKASQAFSPLLSSLESFVKKAKRPVLLIQGDGHQFRFDQPWKTLGDDYRQFWRLQTFGVNANYWVKLRISPDATSPFAIQPQDITQQ